MSCLNTILSSVPFYVSSPVFATRKETTFEASIQSSDLDSLRKLIEECPEILSKPLNNGSYPFAFAVKERKLDCIKLFLELGANPAQRDGQNLHAIDYAIYAEDSEIIATILHHFIDKDFIKLDSVFQDPTSSALATRTLQEILNTAYQELPNVSNQEKISCYSPAQKAVIANNLSVVSSMVDLSHFSLMSITPLGNSVLHLAVMIALKTGDESVLQRLLQSKDITSLINIQNLKGLTALHYAAAFQRLDLMKILIDKGGNVYLPNEYGVLPFTLLRAAAEIKNPLNISKAEMFIFLSSLAYWSFHLLPLSSFSKETYLMTASFIIGLKAFSDAVLLVNSFKTWQECIRYTILDVMMTRALPANSLLSTGFNMVKVSRFAWYTFNNLHKCWKNQTISKGRALLKAIVAYGPAAKQTFDSINQLASKYFAIDYNDNLFIRYQEKMTQLNLCIDTKKATQTMTCIDKTWEMWKACDDNPKDDVCFEAGNRLAEFYQRVKFHNEHPLDYEKVSNPMPNQEYEYHLNCLKDFNSLECLAAENVFKKFIKSRVNDCNEAKMIIGCEQNSSYESCRQIYKQKILSLHPDKTSHYDSNKYQAMVDAEKKIYDCMKPS